MAATLNSTSPLCAAILALCELGRLAVMAPAGAAYRPSWGRRLRKCRPHNRSHVADFSDRLSAALRRHQRREPLARPCAQNFVISSTVLSSRGSDLRKRFASLPVVLQLNFSALIFKAAVT
jgi:hypothetical protein